MMLSLLFLVGSQESCGGAVVVMLESHRGDKKLKCTSKVFLSLEVMNESSAQFTYRNFFQC